MPELRYAKVERTPAVPMPVIAAGAVALAGTWWALRRKHAE